jgi:hypothetical protein
MKVLIRLIEAVELVAPLVLLLSSLGWQIVDEDEHPNITISDDPIFFVLQRRDAQKFFIHESAAPRNIAVGVICFTSTEMLHWVAEQEIKT